MVNWDNNFAAIQKKNTVFILFKIPCIQMHICTTLCRMYSISRFLFGAGPGVLANFLLLPCLDYFYISVTWAWNYKSFSPYEICTPCTLLQSRHTHKIHTSVLYCGSISIYIALTAGRADTGIILLIRHAHKYLPQSCISNYSLPWVNLSSQSGTQVLLRLLTSVMQTEELV